MCMFTPGNVAFTILCAFSSKSNSNKHEQVETSILRRLRRASAQRLCNLSQNLPDSGAFEDEHRTKCRCPRLVGSPCEGVTNVSLIYRLTWNENPNLNRSQFTKCRAGATQGINGMRESLTACVMFEVRSNGVAMPDVKKPMVPLLLLSFSDRPNARASATPSSVP